MKNTNLKLNKIKLIARLMLVILLLTSLLNLTGCMFRPTMVYDEEYYSHEEFVKMIEHYNSINNGSVDKFISFNLDSNDNVSKGIYRFSVITNNKSLIKKYGFLDIYDEYYDVDQICYINNREYKIGYHYDRTQMRQDFSRNDNMEIKVNDKKNCPYSSHDFDYYESFKTIDETTGTVVREELYERMYNYTYHYEFYIKDMKCGCIHISSIDEASEENLNEICRLLIDNIIIVK